MDRRSTRIACIIINLVLSKTSQRRLDFTAQGVYSHLAAAQTRLVPLPVMPSTYTSDEEDDEVFLPSEGTYSASSDAYHRRRRGTYKDEEFDGALCAILKVGETLRRAVEVVRWQIPQNIS